MRTSRGCEGFVFWGGFRASTRTFHALTVQENAPGSLASCTGTAALGPKVQPRLRLEHVRSSGMQRSTTTCVRRKDGFRAQREMDVGFWAEKVGYCFLFMAFFLGGVGGGGGLVAFTVEVFLCFRILRFWILLLFTLGGLVELLSATHQSIP